MGGACVNLPVELLTPVALDLCAYALCTRDRFLLDNEAAVLYDFCIQHGVTKLAPTDVQYKAITPNAHRWLVWDALQSYNRMTARHEDPAVARAYVETRGWVIAWFLNGDHMTCLCQRLRWQDSDRWWHRVGCHVLWIPTC